MFFLTTFYTSRVFFGHFWRSHFKKLVLSTIRKYLLSKNEAIGRNICFKRTLFVKISRKPFFFFPKKEAHWTKNSIKLNISLSLGVKSQKIMRYICFWACLKAHTSLFISPFSFSYRWIFISLPFYQKAIEATKNHAIAEPYRSIWCNQGFYGMCLLTVLSESTQNNLMYWGLLSVFDDWPSGVLALSWP